MKEKNIKTEKEESLNLQKDYHRSIKFISKMHYVWLFLSIYIIYYRFCNTGRCVDNIIETITYTIIPGIMYFIISLLITIQIYEDYEHGDKFSTEKLFYLKLYSITLIILSTILCFANYQVGFYSYLPSLALEILNYYLLKKEYQMNIKIEEKLKTGTMGKYISSELKKEKEKENNEIKDDTK